MSGRWTDNRKKVARFLRDYVASHGRAPTLDEIARGTGLWKRSVEIVLRGLEQMGVITITPGISRGIQLADAAQGLRVPLLGDVHAGPPALSQEEATEYIHLDPRLIPFDNPVALRVQGYSMRDAGILPGDVVLLRGQQTADHGETVVAYYNGGLTVKKLSLEGKRITLLPANPSYRSTEIQKDDDFAIVGKVMLVLRDLGGCFNTEPVSAAA